MKNKSIFSQIMLLVVLFAVCVFLTIGIALLLGACDTTLFDFQNLNLANTIPVLICGGIISGIVMVIMIMVVARSIFFKVKDYIFENGGDKK